MIKNYFKAAWRNLKKQRGFFAINFIGLYISVVVCTLIALIILHELSFDKNTTSNNNIYRVVKNSISASGTEFNPVTPYPLATALRTQLPDEKMISQIHFTKDAFVAIGEKKLKESNIVFADSVFTALFTITVQKGNIQKVLSQPGFAALTESTAKKYFGTEEAIGKRIKLENILDLEVAAVIKDAPGNTHLPYNILVPYLSLKPEFIGNFQLNQWGLNINGYTYMGLADKKNTAPYEAVLKSIAKNNIDRGGTTEKTELKLQPLTDIHYNQLYAEENPAYTINYQYLYLMGAIGLFLILAACINYTNLSTSLAIKKSKEVGVRKTMGASRSHLIKQFFAETFLLTGIVIIAAAITIRFLLPAVNNFLDKNISLAWLNWQTASFLLLLWAAVSLLSGIYPALILSGFNPVNALKNKLSAPKASTLILRKGLVTFQFITAQILIIGAIVVTKQMNFIQSKPLGFTKEKIIDLNLPERKPEQLALLKTKLLNIPGISSVSFSLGAPVSDNTFGTGFNLREKYAVERKDVNLKTADKEYLKTYGLQLLTGRWFDESDERKINPSIPDSLRKYSVVINEAAVKALGFANAQEAIGREVQFGLNELVTPIIGVMKDYHVESLHANVVPVIMMEFPSLYYNAGVKLSDGYSASTIAAIEKAWTSVYPDILFEANFLDEHVASLYKNDKRTLQLFNLSTFLSIVINAMGLIGLLSFMIQQKTKEIGVRKVLGASVANISFILSKGFLQLIGLAFLIAGPVAGYIMNKWLQDFAYRTSISWWVFGIAVALAVLVTAVAVGFQTIKAAIANPIKSLRTE